MLTAQPHCTASLHNPTALNTFVPDYDMLHSLDCNGRVASLCQLVAAAPLQVRDYVRRRRWTRSRVKKPAEQKPGTAISSAGTSPVFGTSSSTLGPGGTRDDPTAGSASFSSQRSGFAGAVAPSAGSQPQLGRLQVNSSNMGGDESSTTSGPEERPYMNLSDVRQGLSAECNKWGSSTVSELHKAISSTGDGEHQLAGLDLFLLDSMECTA